MACFACFDWNVTGVNVKFGDLLKKGKAKFPKLKNCNKFSDPYGPSSDLNHPCLCIYIFIENELCNAWLQPLFLWNSATTYKYVFF